jgi:hypothetical protein
MEYKNINELKKYDDNGKSILAILSFAKTIKDFTENALLEVENAPILKTLHVVKAIYRVAKMYSESYKLSVPYSTEDINHIETFENDMKNIIITGDNGELKSFSKSYETKYNATESLRKYLKYWSSKTKKIQNAYENPYIKAGRITYRGLPTYRFKIGQRVKIKNTNKRGKIVGIQKENGFGKQIYSVKLDSDDKAKSFSSVELEKET